MRQISCLGSLTFRKEAKMFFKKKVQSAVLFTPRPEEDLAARMEKVERRVRNLEDNLLEMEHETLTKEQNNSDELSEFKESVDGAVERIDETLNKFCAKLQELDNEIKKTAHYSVKHEELLKVLNRLSTFINDMKNDIEMPF